MEVLKLHRFLVGWLLLFSSLAQVSVVSVSLEDNPAIQRLREYLRIPTVQPDPNYDPAIEFLQRQADEIGLSATVIEFVEKKPIMLMSWEGSDPSLPTILLNSHMDVVQVDLEKWIHDPFEAYMDEDGNIYARGTQDMKGMGMHYLEAIRILKQMGFKPLRTIYVVFVPDEEIGGAAGWGAFIDSPEFERLNVSIAMDEGTIGSGGTYIATWAEKAPWWLVITATGPTGHGSVYYDGSAMENLFKSIDSISLYREAQMNLVRSGASLGNVVTINAVFLEAGIKTTTGFTMNIQPEDASAGFDIRVPPYPEVAAALERRITEEWAPPSRNLSFYYEQKFETADGEPAVTKTDESNPWWGVLKDSLGKFDGILVPEICTASTDMRYLRQKEIAAFGFSSIQDTPQLVHDNNEFVNGWKWLEGIPVYAGIIEGYASFPGTVKLGDTEDLHRSKFEVFTG